MKAFFYGMVLICLVNVAQATGPRVTSSLLTPPVNELFALDLPAVLSADLADSGIAAAIITAAFKAENVESTITPLPLQTMVVYYLTQENALGIVGHDLGLSAAELKNTIVVPILNLKESYVYYRPKHDKLAWTGKLEDFKTLSIGVNKGEDITPYKKLGIHVEQDRLETRIKALMDGEIDVLREADLTLDAVLAKNFNAQKNDFIRLEPSDGNALVSVLFNKKHSQGAALAKQFQQGLSKLLANGQYDEILKTHSGNVTTEQYFLPLKK